MPELNNEPIDIFAQLSKKIDDQARFTRMLVVVCCLAIVGSMFYSLSSLIATIPDLMLAKFLGNLENIQTEWQLVEQLHTAAKEKNMNSAKVKTH